MTYTTPHYITRSNERCSEIGMDPHSIPYPKTVLSEVELGNRRQEYQEILDVVRFFFDKLLHSLKGTPILVGVADAEGYLLEIEGDATIKSMIDQFGIAPGSRFSQDDTGTNVISLSLEQKEAISLVGTDHYHTFLHEVACYGASFHYIDEDDLLGSLSIMMPIHFKNELFLTMITQVVDSIERELLLRKRNRQLNIMNQIMLDRTQNGIVITDEEGKTLEFNKFAEQLSGFKKEEVLGQDIRVSPITGKYFESVLEEEKIITNEVLPFSNQNDEFLVCLFDAQPMYEKGRMIGAFGQFRDISEQYSLQKKYNYLAFHDDLTELPNRRYFMEEMETVIQEIDEGKNISASLIFIDLDRFKIINDNFGHSNGDRLLVEVSRRLKDCVGPEDFVARMGGDEFIILMKNFQQDSYATSIAERFLQKLHDPFLVEGNEFHTTASVGIVYYPDTPITAETFMVFADNAMYEAKEKGKNTYVVYNEGLLDEAMQEYKLEADLRNAIDHKEFVLHYQPQIDNQTGELAGLEALIRWEHPKLGLLPPGAFIRLAEQNGLITQIGEWVIEEACRQQREWHDQGRKNVTVSVNLSTQQFLNRNLTNFIEQTLQSHGGSPDWLGVEITEYMAMEYEQSVQVLEELKALGVGLSIDDFGTGYSSLNHLKNFQIDFIKIDKSFIQEVTGDHNDAIIVEAIITLAHNLEMKIIAEGVETADQLGFLAHHHCDISQGYLFSRPLPPKEITKEWLK
ncbi:EAL domain-containing protein [Salimicrobium halophilum]|uniref:PAS domain S-box-containing protein/diguanylate cyclase (GGDEF) domain-containing protein n=1 Tax=Salimicrobium halophilum TaxID=86666 RepID=A0A1G8S727_9BACI|nr:EAL domain-containing protein [Salimicrobium halophilum]SDJ24986.1 PAS domain S-box-containing protein/diguanylate cyclase (GGDEF) domain-containing protein [Salimicrobium halophilum]